MKTYRLTIQLLLCVLAGLLHSTAICREITLNAIDRGWYSAGGNHNPSNLNYFVGENSALDQFGQFQYRHFFVFHLPQFNQVEHVIGAQLRLRQPARGVDASRGPLQYETWDFPSAQISSLVAGTGGVAAYNDLGSGIAYNAAPFTIDEASEGTVLSVPLNAAFTGMANFQNNGVGDVDIAIGGAIAGTDGNMATLECAFSFSGSILSDTQLVLTTVIHVPPAVNLFNPNSVTVNSAAVSGTIDTRGSNTTAVVRYTTNGISFDSVNIPLANPAGQTPESFSVTLSSLLPGTTYQWEVRATNDYGTTVLAGNAFTTEFAPPELIQPASNSISSTSVNIEFTLPHNAAAGTVFLNFFGNNGSEVLTLAPSMESAGTHSFTFDPRNPMASPFIVGTINGGVPSGVQQVYLGYRPAAHGDYKYSAYHNNVVVDYIAPEIFENDVFLTNDPAGLVVENVAFVTDNTPFGLTTNLGDFDGDLYPVGDTPVTITATDAAGNTASRSFNVRVQFPTVAVNAAVLKNTPIPSDPNGAVILSFGPPSIGWDGVTVFKGSIKSTAGTSMGILKTDTTGAKSILAKVGDIAPDSTGAASGEQFAGFGEPYINEYTVAFIAKIKGPGITTANDYALFMGDENGFTRVAQEGTIAPGAGGALFKGFVSFSLQEGCLALVATLAKDTGTPIVTSQNDSGVWMSKPFQPTTIALVLREGQQDVVGDGRNLKAFKGMGNVSGTPGMARSHTRYNRFMAAATYDDGTAGVLFVFIQDAGEPEDIYVQPYLDNGYYFANYDLTWLRPGLPATAYNGKTVLKGTVKDLPSSGTSTYSGIFMADSRSSSYYGATLNDPAPDRNGDDNEGLTFKSFKDPAIDYNGNSIIWPAKLAGPGVSAVNDEALYWAEFVENPTPVRVAREGDAALYPGERWLSFKSAAVSGDNVFFTTQLAGAAVSAANDLALYTYSPTMNLYAELLREGKPLALPGGAKTVKTFTILTSVTGSPGVTRSFEENKLAALVSFTDGSTGIVYFTSPF